MIQTDQITAQALKLLRNKLRHLHEAFEEEWAGLREGAPFSARYTGCVVTNERCVKGEFTAPQIKVLAVGQRRLILNQLPKESQLLVDHLSALHERSDQVRRRND